MVGVLIFGHHYCLVDLYDILLIFLQEAEESRAMLPPNTSIDDDRGWSKGRDSSIGPDTNKASAQLSSPGFVDDALNPVVSTSNIEQPSSASSDHQIQVFPQRQLEDNSLKMSNKQDPPVGEAVEHPKVNKKDSESQGNGVTLVNIPSVDSKPQKKILVNPVVDGDHRPHSAPTRQCSNSVALGSLTKHEKQTSQNISIDSEILPKMETMSAEKLNGSHCALTISQDPDNGNYNEQMVTLVAPKSIVESNANNKVGDPLLNTVVNSLKDQRAGGSQLVIDETLNETHLGADRTCPGAASLSEDYTSTSFEQRDLALPESENLLNNSLDQSRYDSSSLQHQHMPLLDDDDELLKLSLTPHLHALLLASMTHRRHSNSCCPHLFERAADTWWNPRQVASYFFHS